MSIFKSHKVIFITKLALLLLLLCITGFASVVIGTGGIPAHDFPFTLILGPVNILSAFSLHGRESEIYACRGIIFLYVMYALLLKFIKSGKTFLFVLVFHIVSALIAMRLFFGTTLGNYSLFETRALVSDTIILALWALVIWLLKSIHKSRGLW